jgi:hypothetical protein
VLILALIFTGRSNTARAQTDTPIPTSTDTPAPTLVPTDTPTPTLVPTDTPTPTATLIPTDTPTPTSECGSAAPGSTPQLLTATSAGTHQVTLTWSQATDPVSNYLVAYGTASGQYQYGNPDIGGQGTTSYTVGSLASGVTYYFVVMAVNGCAASSFSNELSVLTGPTPTPTQSLSPTPTAEVLGLSSSQPQVSTEAANENPAAITIIAPTLVPTPTPVPTGSSGPNKTALILVTAFLGLILLGGGSFFLYQELQKKNPPNTS